MIPGFEVREARETDAAGLLDLHLALDRESAFMLFEPGERSTDVAAERERIGGVLSRVNQTLLVAESGDLLVGYVAVLGGQQRRNRHTAHLVIGVRRESGGRGVGRALLETAVAWAERVGIHRLELTVMAHNARAIGLYERMGFGREGIRREALLVDGAWVDELYMAMRFPSA